MYIGYHVTGGTSGKVVILREKLNEKYRIKFFHTKLCLFLKRIALSVYRVRVHFDQDSTELLEDIPLEIRRNLIYQQDGVPSHFSREVRHFLNENYQY